MPSMLADLPFIDLYIRLDGDERPMYRSTKKGQNRLNLFVPEEFIPATERLSAFVKEQLEVTMDGSLDFEGLRCRMSRQTMADGSLWACARRININIPNLGDLGFAPHIRSHLHSLGLREGLILISGSAGQGKTTTAVGLLVDYMRSYGGTAITIEDPVEYVLKGRHGDFGQCFQIEIKNDDEWAGCLKRTLRWTPRYVYVGEVRTPQAAEQLLHAATTGHTVITTMHAGAPEEALTGLLFLAEQAMGPGCANILAGSLTALLHQTLKEEGPFVRYLFTEENAPGDPIRSLIREGKIGMMSTYIDRIAARLANQPVMGGGAMGSGAGGLPPLPPSGNRH